MRLFACRQPLAGLLAIAATALLAAGCGSSAKTAFAGRFAPLDDELSQTLGSATFALQKAASESDVQLADSLVPVTARLQGLTSELAALHPPASVSTDYTELTREVGQVSLDLTNLASAVRSHDIAASRTYAERYLSDVGAVTPTAAKLRKELGLHPRG